MRKNKTLGHIIYILTKPLQWTMLHRWPPRAYVQIEYKNNILLVRNWLGSGKWSYPGGGVHRHENSKDGACREVLEEIGLVLNPKDIQLLASGFTKYFLGGKKFVIYKVTLVNKPEIKITSELNGYFWATRDEIKNYRITNEVGVALATSASS